VDLYISLAKAEARRIQGDRQRPDARGELDDNKRAAMYREMQLLVRDEGGAVIPAFANDVFATRDTVRHGKLASNYEVDGRMFFDRWWFA
jgi:peptide/nickel transport system substrate-binding protein